MKRSSSRLKPIIIVVCLLLLAVGGWWFLGHHNNAVATKTSTASTQESQHATTKQTDSTVRLIAVGDVLPHSAISQSAKKGSTYDYQPFFSEIKPYFQSADVRFCNQETVSAGESYGISGYPAFNVSKQFARDMSADGCNVINLANNHLNDKGQAGINETLSVWDELKPLAIAGANRSAEEQAKVRYFTAKGIKFAFVAYTEISNTHDYTSYGLNMLNDTLVRNQLTEARKAADIVLVSVHWGTEYSPGINNAQERWANTFAGYGADVVIGTGPHVLEPVKRIPRQGGGETLVWYSLGNILSAQLEVESLMGGLAVMDFDTNTKQLKQTGFLPTYMHYEWTPEQKAREDLLARHDFMIYPLDKAAGPLSRSQNGTTVEAQTSRIDKLLNSYTSVKMLTSNTY